MVSPWSPPEYMKKRTAPVGRTSEKEYYPDWARIYRQYILALQAEGFPVKTNVHSERGKRSTEMGFLPVQCRGGERVSENSSLSCAEKTWAG